QFGGNARGDEQRRFADARARADLGVALGENPHARIMRRPLANVTHGVRAAYSGEHTRLACWRTRLGFADFPAMRSRNQLFALLRCDSQRRSSLRRDAETSTRLAR